MRWIGIGPEAALEPRLPASTPGNFACRISYLTAELTWRGGSKKTILPRFGGAGHGDVAVEGG
jgi:hypothetical protein